MHSTRRDRLRWSRIFSTDYSGEFLDAITSATIFENFVVQSKSDASTLKHPSSNNMFHTGFSYLPIDEASFGGGLFIYQDTPFIKFYSLITEHLGCNSLTEVNSCLPIRPHTHCPKQLIAFARDSPPKFWPTMMLTRNHHPPCAETCKWFFLPHEDAAESRQWSLYTHSWALPISENKTGI